MRGSKNQPEPSLLSPPGFNQLLRQSQLRYGFELNQVRWVSDVGAMHFRCI